MKKAAFLLLISLFVLSIPETKAQGFTRYDSIPVTVNSNTLKYPWCGGLNYAQMYSIDINGDGLKDLFTYDRSSAKYRTYINTGTPGDYHYVYSPQYEWRFPGPFNNWVQLFDFNCDGKEDIFTYDNGFIKVFRNDYTTTNGLSFSPYLFPVFATYPTSGYANILISSQTFPSFSDVDNDGDLDILVYGITVGWYQNMAQESYGRCDTLVFNYATDCWGNFSSFGNPTWNVLTFGISCRSNGSQPDTTQSSQHSGQSILAIDLDGDLDKDVLIGDVIQNNITESTNTGTVFSPNMTSQDTAFPNYSTPAASTTMNCCFYTDMDNDGKNDLIVSPWQSNISDNFLSVWCYKNTGTTASPVFSFQQKDYMQSEMIETGEGCNPVFFDYDLDGKQDLIIGNYGYWSPQLGNGFEAELSLYKNVGSTTVPSFDLVTRDYAHIDSIIQNNFNVAINNTAPTFGDLDGDGDMDMLVGNEDGTLFYYDNYRGSGNPCAFSWNNLGSYQGIDVGLFATPQLIDVDRDGKLDLIIGNRNGMLSYYHNTGTLSSPVFNLVTATFGGVDVRQPSFVTGFSTPCMFDSAGSYRLIVGSEEGHLHYYKNIDGNLSGNFTQVDPMYSGIWEGKRSSPFMKDINGDGLLDLIVGNYSGGVAFYYGDLYAGIHDPNADDFIFDLYPNPAGNFVSISINSGTRSKNLDLKIYSVLGAMVKEIPLSINEKIFTINTEELTPGIYFCKLNMNGTEKVKKLIIQH